LMLQSRIRFCVSTDWAPFVPRRRIRSSSRRGGARHSARRRGRSRRSARLIRWRKWIRASAATIGSRTCSTWLSLTIYNPALSAATTVDCDFNRVRGDSANDRRHQSDVARSKQWRKESGATMNGTVASNEATGRKVVDSVWWTLRMSFGLVPLLAGLDKFFNLLAHWPKYVAPLFAHALPATPQQFMYVVGVIEIVAGLGMLLSPWTKVFSYVVAAWLIAIAVNLIAGGFYDIAVRDLAMAASAISLGRLTDVVHVAAGARRLETSYASP
jgi:uncharacterized membrane protein YphA (DoxX/SURF4 family)